MPPHSNKSIPHSDTLTLTTLNTEYSYTVPLGVRYIVFKLRSATPNLYMSYATGNVPNGAGGKYMTIAPGTTKSVDFFSASQGIVIYFSSDTSTQVLEIEYWL